MQDSDKVGKFFTTTGKDIWECVSYCGEPTITYKNLHTGRLQGGAVNSLNTQGFKLLEAKEQP